MQTKISAVLAALCALCWSQSASANALTDAWQHYNQVWQNGKTGYGIDIDNDSLLLQDKDGLYTSGAALRVVASKIDGNLARVAGWHLSHDIYSPTDINLLPAQVNRKDHPYAAWLYTGWFAETYQADGRYLKSGIDFGCIGPCAGGESAQRNLHRILNQPLPRGWDLQIKNEFGLQGAIDWAPVRYVLGGNADLTPNLAARLGNIFTDATIGGTLRLGRLNALPQQRTSHLMLRLEARAVGYNATLQGGRFSSDSPHTVKPKTWVGEAELGWNWVGQNLASHIGIIHRTNEIRDFSNARGAENFARIQLTWTP
jgi:hypothetical protein